MGKPMKDDQEEAFEKILSTQLGGTIDFVKFAETKNAALLTFSSAWIIGTINLLTGPNPACTDQVKGVARFSQPSSDSLRP
jgi:hypothetical protein